MEPKIAVVVQVDLDGRQVRVVVTGVVTEINQRGLCPVIGRARRLVPGIRVVADLSGADSVEPTAVDLLRWSAEHEDPVVGAPPVEFRLTGPGAAPVTSAADILQDEAPSPVRIAPRTRISA